MKVIQPSNMFNSTCLPEKFLFTMPASLAVTTTSPKLRRYCCCCCCRCFCRCCCRGCCLITFVYKFSHMRIYELTHRMCVSPMYLYYYTIESWLQASKQHSTHNLICEQRSRTIYFLGSSVSGNSCLFNKFSWV